MPTRYGRDELIRIALNMAQVPNLEIHDIPNGVVQIDAYSIQWLQDILDFWYHMVPFSTTVVKVSLPIPALSTDITLPDDFILDVRNGIIIESIVNNTTSNKRMHRVPLQKWINRDLYSTSISSQLNGSQYPSYYMIQGSVAKITPQSPSGHNAQLWYYALPPILQGDERPTFPNDYVITEYIRIRALEWCQRFEPGTAQKFCDKVLAGMRASGLLNEPESDEIPFDDLTYSQGSNRGPFAWMGQR